VRRLIVLGALKSNPWPRVILPRFRSRAQICNAIFASLIGRLLIGLVALISVYADANKDVLRLRDQLISTTASDRRDAAQALGRMGRNAQPAILDLIHALQDPNSDVQEAAAEALRQIGEESVPALIDTLKDQRPEVRAAAAHGLAHLGPSARPAVKDLIRALEDDDRRVREFATGALGNLGADAVEDLIRASNTHNEEVRENAAIALANIGQPSVPRLLGELVTGNPEIRASAAHALGHVAGRVSSKEAFYALLGTLHDPDIKVRNAGVQALVNIGPKAVPSLIESLKDPAPEVRVLASTSLERIGAAKQSIPRLMDVLKDSNPDVRVAAAHALVSVAHRLYLDDDPEAVPLLTVIEPALRAAPGIDPVHADEIHSELANLERIQVQSWVKSLLKETGHPLLTVATLLVALIYLLWALILGLVILRHAPLRVLAWNESLAAPTDQADVEISVFSSKLKLSLNSLGRRAIAPV
jgi:HEAT repeat protein